MAEESTTITRLAPYREEYEKQLLQALAGYATPSGYTQGLAGTPVDIPEYQVAALAPETLQAFQMAKAGIGAYQPYLQASDVALGESSKLYSGASGALNQGMVTAMQGAPSLQTAATTLGGVDVTKGTGTYAPTAAGIQAFMDPYQQLVTQEALKQMDREAAIAQQGLSQQAVQAGAFGGGREGVQRAELARNLQDIKSQRIAEDLQKNYLQALQGSSGAFESGQTRQLQGAELQQQLGSLQAALAGEYGKLGSTIGALGTSQAGIGQLYGDLATQMQQAAGTQQGFLGQDIGALESIGAQQRQQQQAALDAQRQTLLQQAYEPYQRLGFMSDVMRGLPTGTGISQTTAPGVSPLAQATGAGITGLSLYGAFTNQPWASNLAKVASST